MAQWKIDQLPKDGAVSRLQVQEVQSPASTRTGNTQQELGQPIIEIQGDEDSDNGMPLGIDYNTRANRQ